MNILVIGGTEFVGRHLVERGLILGHRLTLFHRGKHGTDLFPEVERIHGDRDGGISALGDRHWDAVIDTCGYVPRVVRQSADYLKDRVGRYLFISTISVLADLAEVGQSEASPLAKLDDPSVEVVDGKTYGGLKVLCEEAVNEVYGSKATNVRPGMIVGPYDKTGRFPYWFMRAKRGGKMLSLQERDEPVQFIDGRDLAHFCFHLLEDDRPGVFMSTGPEYPMNWGDVFDSAALIGDAKYDIVRPPVAWLEAQGVDRRQAFPSQMPEEANVPGFYQIDNMAAVEAGLTFRPLEEIVGDTLSWCETLTEHPNVGFTPEREAELIEAYERAEL